MDTNPTGPTIVQSSQMPSGKNLIPTSLPRVVFVVLILIIVAELIWGGFYLLKPVTAPSVNKAPAVQVSTPLKPRAELILSTDASNVKVGDTIKVDVTLVGGDSDVVGTDLIVKYDADLLSITDSSFVKGDAFPEYLGQTTEKGVFGVSGLADPFISLEGEKNFGSLNFKARALGTAKIDLEFVKNSTTDSNVIDAKSGRDVLEQVSGLTVTIN